MRVNTYMDPEDSIAQQTLGYEVDHVLTTIAQRYIGNNPSHPPVYRVSRKSAIRKMDDHRYEFPMDRIFPQMPHESKVYAWAKLWVDNAELFPMLVSCFGQVRLYHNGSKRFGSSQDEVGSHIAPLKLHIPLERGWNYFLLEFEQGEHGCGAIFGTGNRKNRPLHFLVPSMDRDGEEGWIYTEPLMQELAYIPTVSVPEAATGVRWFPEQDGESAVNGQFTNLYGTRPGNVAYAWTKIENLQPHTRRLTFHGMSHGPLCILINGIELYRQLEYGPLEVSVDVLSGAHDLIVSSIGTLQGWGFTLQVLEANIELQLPRDVRGSKDIWLYMGPFDAKAQIDITAALSMDSLMTNSEQQPCYWRVSEPNGYVRPFLENELFGKWNYPLGVTLYGLHQLGKELQRTELIDYVWKHIQFATSLFDYSEWDRQQFGAAGVNNQLSQMDSLDDCGSFGALMLLANKLQPLKDARHVAHTIADYIMNKQDRMKDGALYRKVGVSLSMHNTMWCDDMYMSVPFLCRYAELTEDNRYLDEAAKQLLLYKEYLYMPDKQIMSHVYDVKGNKPTLTPWGRGNGWVIFSLTELLTILPQEHSDYEVILGFYRELASGFVKLQGSNGLWHQVLTDPESYEESSCTSMFIYSFARGIRYGWLEDEVMYRAAVRKGWHGLCRNTIDKRGNIFGVCKGSSYSFSNHYYKHELSWSLNDTHGIGIVMLAGIENLRLQKMIKA